MPPLLWCLFFCPFTHLKMPRSPPKFNVLHCTTQDPSIKFHPNPFITFWVMLSTDRQTDKQTDKPTLPKTWPPEDWAEAVYNSNFSFSPWFLCGTHIAIWYGLSYNYCTANIHIYILTSFAKEVMFLVALVCLSVCLSVCLWTTLLKNLWMDWDEILQRGLG